MFSDIVPPFVLPDTEAARVQAITTGLDDDFVGFCPRFVLDEEALELPGFVPATKPCKHRVFAADNSHNWCVKCPCGFLIHHHN